jgi:hypothetical protein
MGAEPTDMEDQLYFDTEQCKTCERYLLILYLICDSSSLWVKVGMVQVGEIS